MSENRSLNLNLKNLLLTGLVGWIISLYTLWHRSKVLAGLDIGESFCNLSSKINCDNVALSSYSKILGISVPTYGLIFFSIVSLLAMRALGQRREKSAVGQTTVKLLTLCSAVGVITSIGLGLLSLTQIGSFCLVCAIIYALCFWLTFLVWKTKKLHGDTQFVIDSLSPTSIFVFGAVVIAQFAFQPLGDYAATAGRPQEEELPAEFLSQIKTDFEKETSYEIPLQDSPSFGPNDSKITIVEFSDFQCPHCASNFKNMPATLYPYKDHVRVIYKNFPLDPACNSGGSHRNACFAARASRCVFKKQGADAFKKIQSYLFENRDTFTKDSVKEKVLSLGLSQGDFDSCIDSAQVVQEIKDEIELAKSVGVEGTPAIFINGKQLKMGTQSAVLSAILKELTK